MGGVEGLHSSPQIKPHANRLYLATCTHAQAHTHTYTPLVSLSSDCISQRDRCTTQTSLRVFFFFFSSHVLALNRVMVLTPDKNIWLF